MKRLISVVVAITILAVGVRLSQGVLLRHANGKFGPAFSESRIGSFLNSLGTERVANRQYSNAGGLDTVWTLANGRQFEAVILAADSRNVQLRSLKSQEVEQVKLAVFAEPDQEKILSWLESEGKSGLAGRPIPLKSHRWPRDWRAEGELTLQQIDDTNRWNSAHFEIINEAGVNRESLESLVTICESVDGALSALPLPLPVNWGRPTDEKRKIIIESENSPKLLANTAGYWNSGTGTVHIFVEHLLEPDHQFVVFEFDKPEKVQKYDILVHEVTHQSTAALIYMNVPAWLTEGLAEYMAATQQSPASYYFDNTHVTLRYHINKLVLGDRIVKERRLNLVHLEKLMNRDIREWNRIVEEGDSASGLQYSQALLLIDYFCHRDHSNGVHFRKYLEAILSGVSEFDARHTHLLRGRSYQDIEKEMIDLWKPLKFAINFQDRGEIKEDDVTIDWEAEDIKKTLATQRAIRARAE
ncbi:hypothetical protein VSU19_03775 [Verrucomicrobiales bacterium BCK34]|nr:hypothetical protein [Verrucomicrobiales bacterium BCK34]